MAAEQTEELRRLPAEYGFDSVRDFIRALKQAASASKARRGRKPKGAQAVAQRPTGRKRRRAKITPEMKDQLRSLVDKREDWLGDRQGARDLVTERSEYQKGARDAKPPAAPATIAWPNVA